MVDGHGKNQVLTTVVVSLAYASVGCCFAWTSPSLPKLLDTSLSRIPMTEEDGSWVASTLGIGAMISPLIACWPLNFFGRKRTILLNSILLIIGWSIILLADSIEVLIIGRITSGLACGIMFLALPMYIAEITEDSLRQTLICGSELSIALGCNIEYYTGPYLPYDYLIILSMMVPATFIVLFIWLPDSPYYQISNGKKEEALKTLRWLRGDINEEDAEKEMIIILSTMYEELNTKTCWMDLIQTKGNLKGLIITSVLVTAGQFSGINVIQLYSELIFIKSGSNIPPKYCAMAVGTFQFISSCMAPTVSKKFGYRKPLIVASIIIGVTHLLIGLYFYLDSREVDMTRWGWLPVTCLVIFMLTFSSTYGPIPWGVLGEIFPTNIKVRASALVTSLCLLHTFVTTKFFNNIAELFGICWGFWIFSISMALSIPFVICCLPETQGMSLQEIQDILNKESTKKSDHK